MRFLRVFEEPSGHDGVLIPGCFRFGACWSADGTSLWIPRCGGEVATVRRIPCSSLWSSPVSQPIGLGVRTEVGVEKYVELNDGLVGCLPEELVDFIDYASQTMLSWGENIERKVMRKDLDSSIFIKNKTLQTDSKVPDSTGDSEINGEIRMVKDQVDARWIENDSGWMPAGVRNILEIWNLFHSGDREKLLKWLKKSVSLDVGLVSPLAHEIVTGGANAVNLVEDLQLAPLASLLYSNASTTHVRELLNQSFIEMKNKNYSNDECLIISALLGKTDDFFVAAGIPPNWKVALLIMLLYQKNKSIIDIVMVEFKGTRETSGNQENTEFLAAVLSTLSFLRSLQFRKEESSGISGDILLNSDSLNKELMSSISIKLLEGFDDYYHQFCLIYSVPGMVELLPKELHERSQRHLREYLSSLGYWHQINQFRDEYEISLYLKIEEERSLMRTSQRANYLKQEMRLKRVFGDYNLYVAYANRCKYFKCLKQAAYYLVIVGRYEEARDLLLPIILNYCKRGLDPSDDMVKDILSMFPTDLLSEFHLQFVTPRIQ